jgi:histidinol dehydrogenase
MIRRIDLRSATTGRPAGEPFDYRTAVPRADFDVEAAVPAVHAICEGVRTGGLEALLDYCERFDGVRPDDIRVPAGAARAALDDLDPAIRAGLEESIRRLRLTCEAELERDAVTDLGPGARVTHRKVPMNRVGLYVPGGIAPLVSSVLMNVVPAQVAGVRSIALASPPQKDFGGSVHPTILAACALLGVEEVYTVGGAQAIAMFAYGTGPCARVDFVTGPGNIFTVTACSRASSASTPRPVPPRSGSWPTTPPTPPSSPRTWSARPSTTRWPPPCWSPPPSDWPTRSRSSWTSRSSPRATSNASAPP